MADNKPIIYHGWIIVGIAILGMVLLYGIRHSFSVFFSPVLDEFGWNRGETAIMLSLNLLIYALLAPFAGSLADRWKPRNIFFIGITIVMAATACCAFASELWHFYLLFGVIMPVGTVLCGSPLLIPALTHWFLKRRGLILGLGQIGGGLSFVYGMYANYFISLLGWRSAFLVFAGTLLILLPLFYLFYYYRPQDKGIVTDFNDDGMIEKPQAVITQLHDWTPGKLLRSYRLWLLVICEFLYWGMGCYLVLAHQVKYAIDVGYTSTFAASVFALFGVCLIAGLLSAFISDRIGREITVVVSVLLAIGGLVALISIDNNSQDWLLLLYAILFGYAAGLVSPAFIAGAADLFHGNNFGLVFGLLMSGVGIGGAIGPWLGGYVYDMYGSYSTAFIISTAGFALCGIIFYIAAPRSAKRQ